MEQRFTSILTEYELLIATLLVHVAFVAMVASVLLRSRRFQRLILAGDPTRAQCLRFGALLGGIAAAGAWTRLNLGYVGADASISLAMLSGLSMGPWAGFATGAVAGVVPFRHGEWLALPVGALVGAAIGATHRLVADPGEFWDFSPMPLRNALHAWQRWRATRELDVRLLVIFVVATAEAGRTELARFGPRGWLFGHAPVGVIPYYLVIMATLMCIGVSLRIWGAPRMWQRLRRQEALLAEARFTALRDQMNPHFLFNTLNTILSLVRTNPDTARSVIVKLSVILRRLLYAKADICPLKDELGFVRDYISIEQSRFGAERLRVEIDVADDLLSAPVPTMVLQPLVENAIKHGLSGRPTGGVIRVGAHANSSTLEIRVHDNGVGMSEAKASASLRKGIGLNNIRERLRTLYGEDALLDLRAIPGRGTTACVRLPLSSSDAAASGSGSWESGEYIGD